MSSPAENELGALVDANTLREIPVPTPGNLQFWRGQVAGRATLLLWQGPPTPGDETKFTAFAIARLQEAGEQGQPVVLVLGGVPSKARAPGIANAPQTLLLSRQGMGGLFAALGRLRGKVPLLCIARGPVGGPLTFPPMLCDAFVMTRDSSLCLGRPSLIEWITGEKHSLEALAHPDIHAKQAGTADFIADTFADAATWARAFLAAAIKGGHAAAEPAAGERPLADVVPASPRRLFDMRQLIARVVDDGSLVETQAHFAGEVVTAFARVAGKQIGVLANNSVQRGGFLFPESCRKLERFLSLCDRNGVPAVFLMDSPGFMVGPKMEAAGITAAAASLFRAIAQARVPRLSVVVRRGYSAGVYAMAGGGMGADEFIALPTACLSIYGPTILDKLREERSLTTEKSVSQMTAGLQDPAALKAQGLLDAIVPVTELRTYVSDFLTRHARAT